MMRNLFLVVLFSCMCYGEEIREPDEEVPGYNLQGIEREFREQDKDIHRPCPSFDLLCISRYLAKRSKCKITHGPVPDPIYQKQANLYIPSQNLSVIENGVYLGGLTGSVTEFYVNRKDELTILAVEFRNVTRASTSSRFRYQRRGQEPIVTNATTSQFFPSFTTTTVLRGVKQLRLANSETAAFFNAPLIINVDPSAGIDDTDPTIAVRFASFIASLPVVGQEAFLTEAPYYAATYIQYALCDFGLKVN